LITFQHYKSPDTRFVVAVANITQMSKIGSPCKFIANESNWRLKASAGTPINKGIHAAVGASLEAETKRRLGIANLTHLFRYPFPALVGKCYPVPISDESPLSKNEGVGCVLHCLGPK
jgi:hypothetical protein